VQLVRARTIGPTLRLMLPSHWIQVGRTETAVMSEQATAASMTMGAYSAWK
jgi:hypothetical protein